MAFKCGSCHGLHETVGEARLCAGAPERVVAVKERRLMVPLKPSTIRRDESRAEQLVQINALGMQIPAAAYALRNEAGAENDIQFVHVERPTKGRWAGKTFVKRQLGPELQKLPLGDQLSILTRISQDVQGAMRLYGVTIGKCGNCHLPLTNQESREYGIGPICRANLGY